MDAPRDRGARKPSTKYLERSTLSVMLNVVDAVQQCATRGSLAQLTAVLWSGRGPGIRRARCSLEARRDRNLRASAVDPLRSFGRR